MPNAAAHLLSNHYNLTRDEYYRQLQRASDSEGDVIPFLLYAIRGFVDGIRAQLDLVWAQQYQSVWAEYVREVFEDRPETDAKRRQLHLVMTLTQHDGPIARRDIPALTPTLTLAYSGTQRMLSRDLNTLERLGLIEQAGHGLWRARQEQILAFRPLRLAA